jgi:hypothetical protein
LLLQVEVEIWPRTKLKDGAETVVVNLNGVKLLDHTSMVEVLVDLILSNSMLDVVVLDLLRPAVVEVMNLACHFTAVF